MSQRVAIVCDWLTEGFGGAERVIAAVAQLYRSAPIYTSQYRPAKTAWLGKADVRVGWLNYFPAWTRRLISPLRAFYFSHLDLSQYDVVISISGAEAKYVKTGALTKHISYIHAPTQYYWGKYDQYLKDAGFGLFNPLVRLFLKLLIRPLRRVDFKYAQRPDVLLANSSFIKDEIKRYYQRDARVVFPPVEVAHRPLSPARPEGWVVVSRLVNWKRVDLSIEAAKLTGDQLRIIGEGSDKKKLEKLAQGYDNISFLPASLDDHQMAQALQSSRAVIFSSCEPFGIAPVEALMLGVPVIAYRAGGALDFIIEGQNGVFFDHQTSESLLQAIEKFRKIKFSSSEIKKSSAKFSTANFRRQIRQIVAEQT
jgi:glycosyltransferase involved in cell wall biosynthesis